MSSYLQLIKSSAGTEIERGGSVDCLVRQQRRNGCTRIQHSKLTVKGSQPIYLCAYYRPNVADESSLQNFERSLRKAAEKRNACLLIAGDLNFPGINSPSMTADQAPFTLACMSTESSLSMILV